MILTKLLDDFLSGYRSEEVLHYFHEVFDQEGFGQNKYHRFDVLNHTRELIRIYRSADFVEPSTKQYLATEIEGECKSTLLQLAMCFHDAGKKVMKETTGSMKGHAAYTVQSQLRNISQRFNLSLQQEKYMADIILFHDFILNNDEGINRFLSENNIFPEGLIISLCDILATQGEASFGEEDLKKIKAGKERLKNLFT